jgi:crossover junction endodeoxyribonuclease RuvC
MRILGIDPGSRVLGYAVIEGPASGGIHPRQLRPIEVGVLRTPNQATYPERLTLIYQGVSDVISRLSPTYCALERAFTGINSMSALRMGETRGAVMVSMGLQRLPVAEISPARVKNVITGRGNATKDHVALALKMLVHFERGTLPYDATDALAVAVAFALSKQDFIMPLATSESNQTRDPTVSY